MPLKRSVHDPGHLLRSMTEYVASERKSLEVCVINIKDTNMRTIISDRNGFHMYLELNVFGFSDLASAHGKENNVSN